jgi:predicted Na+-dependent transporter
MRDLAVGIVTIGAPVCVALIVFAQSLGIAPGGVASYFIDRPWVMLRSLVAALVVVPAVALALILVLEPAPGVAVGLAIMVACPPAPLMLNTAPKTGGANAAFMASLRLSLAALAFVTLPLTLDLVSIPLGFHADVDLLAMGWVLARTLVLPIGLGIAVRALFPRFAVRAAPGVAKVGALGFLVVLVFVVAALYSALVSMDAWSYVVIALVAAAALAVGHWFGPANPDERTTLAIECGVRHPGLALTIGAANFTPERALPVVVPCMITFVLVATAYLILRRRSLARAARQRAAGG